MGTGFVNAASGAGVVLAKNAGGLLKLWKVDLHELATGRAVSAFPIGNERVDKLRPLRALLMVVG
jgi:hypothetical protein